MPCSDWPNYILKGTYEFALTSRIYWGHKKILLGNSDVLGNTSELLCIAIQTYWSNSDVLDNTSELLQYVWIAPIRLNCFNTSEFLQYVWIAIHINSDVSVNTVLAERTKPNLFHITMCNVLLNYQKSNFLFSRPSLLSHFEHNSWFQMGFFQK